MKTSILALSLIAASFSSYGTTKPPATTTAPSAQAGAIAGAAALSSSRSSVRSTTTSTATGGAASITGLMNMQGATLGGGGAGGAGGFVGEGAGALNLSGARIGSGDTNVPKQTPPSYAPAASMPVLSCRPTFGLGLAGSGASGSGGLPWFTNDAICLHKKRDDTMQAANARRARTFTDDDFLRNDCTVEGMADTSACKDLATRDSKKTTASEGVGFASPVASLQLLP